MKAILFLLGILLAAAVILAVILAAFVVAFTRAVDALERELAEIERDSA